MQNRPAAPAQDLTAASSSACIAPSLSIRHGFFTSDSSVQNLPPEVKSFLTILAKPQNYIESKIAISDSIIISIKNHSDALVELIAKTFCIEADKINKSEIFENAVLRYALILKQKMTTKIKEGLIIYDCTDASGQASFNLENKKIIIYYHNLSEAEITEVSDIYKTFLHESNVTYSKHEENSRIYFELCFNAEIFAKRVIPEMKKAREFLLENKISNQNAVAIAKKN